MLPLRQHESSRWRTFKTLKLNVWKKSKESFHIFISFQHLEKSLGLWEMLIATANINWIQTRNWKAKKTIFQASCFYKRTQAFPKLHQALQKQCNKARLMKLFFSRDNGLSQSTWIWTSAFEHVATTNIFQKAVTESMYVDFFTLFSHKIPHLLFKNSATSVFLIQINTVLLKQSKSLCRTVFVMLLPSEPVKKCKLVTAA